MRGRPKLIPAIHTEKWTNEVFEVPSKPEIGKKFTYFYDENKSICTPNFLYKTEVSYPKDVKNEKIKIEKGKAYNGQPVVMVFKTSERSNAKTKMKIWNNESIDYIIPTPELPGVPNNAIILECGVGKSFIKTWSEKYSL